MALQLDPELPHFWLDSQTIRIGFDEDHTGPIQLNRNELPLLADLIRGISESGLDMVAEKHKVSGERVEELKSRFAPAYVRQPFAVRNQNTGISLQYFGDKSLTQLLKSYLGDRYFVGLRNPPFESSPTIALMPTRYVLLPMHCQKMMSRDVWHIPIVFSDTSIRVGPAIVPGRTACSFCHIIQLHQKFPDFGKVLNNPFQEHTFSERSHLFYAAIFGITALLEKSIHDIVALQGSGKPFPTQSITYSADGSAFMETWEPQSDCSCVKNIGQKS